MWQTPASFVHTWNVGNKLCSASPTAARNIVLTRLNMWEIIIFKLVLRGSSPCTDLSLVVRCDYVNERANVKLALSFCTTWLNMVAARTALN